MRLHLWLSTLLLLSGCAAPPSQAHKDEPQRPRITIGSGPVEGCRLVTHPRPVYPKEAKQKRIQGTVQLRVLITKAGEVHILDVLKGDPQLIPAAVQAASKWRYTPCLFNSEAVEIKTQIDISFNLNQ